MGKAYDPFALMADPSKADFKVPDLLPAPEIGEARLDRRFTVILSPAFGLVPVIDLANWLLASGLDVRMQLQLHKYVWDPKARGV